MRFRMGPRALGVYDVLRSRIVGGELSPDDQLPSYLALAAQYGVAPLTVRLALAQLAQDGLVTKKPGLGTYVRTPTVQTILIVDDEPAILNMLCSFVELRGVRAIASGRPAEALHVLESGVPIALILSDVRMPAADDGVEFIRSARRRWPEIPLAAITGYPRDLEALLGTPEWPILVLTKPASLNQVQEVLRLIVAPEVLLHSGAPDPSRASRASSRA